MKIKLKRWFVVLVATVVVLPYDAARAQQDNSEGWGLSFGYSYDHVTVGDMAFTLRNVPAHPDDFTGYPGAIARLDYDANHGGEMAFGYMWDGSLGTSLRTKYGLGLKWLLYPSGFGADMERRNYSNAPGTSTRGYGAALTFLSFGRYGPIPSFDPVGDFFLAWTPTAKFEIGPKEGRLRNFTLGTEVSYCEYRVVTGWDRYDKLEQRDAKTLAYCIPVRLYVGYWQPDDTWVFRVGAQFQPLMKTSLGRESKISAPAVTGFVSVGYTF